MTKIKLRTRLLKIIPSIISHAIIKQKGLSSVFSFAAHVNKLSIISMDTTVKFCYNFLPFRFCYQSEGLLYFWLSCRVIFQHKFQILRNTQSVYHSTTSCFSFLKITFEGNESKQVFSTVLRFYHAEYDYVQSCFFFSANSS